eukprot:1054027-Prymnesium_polylepis.2
MERCVPSDSEEPSTRLGARLADALVDFWEVEDGAHGEGDAAEDIRNLNHHFFHMVAHTARLRQVGARDEQDHAAPKDEQPASDSPAVSFEVREKQNGAHGKARRSGAPAAHLGASLRAAAVAWVGAALAKAWQIMSAVVQRRPSRSATGRTAPADRTCAHAGRRAAALHTRRIHHVAYLGFLP